MALTVRKDAGLTDQLGMKVLSGEIDFDSSYPTGGEAIDLSAEFSVIKAAFFEGRTRLFELTSKNNPSACMVKVYQGDNDAAVDGPAAEVPNATDLSAITKVGFFIIGRK